MKESYRKGVANHPDPESCVASRKAAIEALTGAHAGRVLSCEIIAIRSADAVPHGGRQHRRVRYRKSSADSAQSETPGMHGNSTRENRETPSTPVGEDAAGRLEKAMSQKSNMHVGGESDGCVVPTKCPNKGGQPSAEGMEGRRPTKENTEQATAPRTQSRISESSGLLGVREVSTEGQADAVHRAAPPRHGRSAAGQLLRPQAESCARSGRRDVEEYETGLDGRFIVKRQTIRKRLSAKLQELKEELRRRWHTPVAEVGQWLRSVVQGYFNYHAVPGNMDSLNSFRGSGHLALVPRASATEPARPG